MKDAVLCYSESWQRTTSESDLLLSLPKIEEFETTFQCDYYPSQSIEAMEATESIHVSVTDSSELEHEFERLAYQWLEGTKYSSSIIDIISHPAHMRIIGMGPRAIPWILNRLARDNELWFWALCFITGEDPITEDIRGNVQQMRQAWLDWGQENGMF